VKDDYKKLSHEWGSKRRKADSRQAKSMLKKPSKEDLAELEQEKIMDAIQERMVNPPDNCDGCGGGIDQYSRQWNGNGWFCDGCAEERQQ
jgi:formylmethanofuran dehydrogenase subunit E